MLIRNTEWAAAFFEDVGQYAYMHRDTIEQYMQPVRMHADPAVCAMLVLAASSAGHRCRVNIAPCSTGPRSLASELSPLLVQDT